ncbi:hypothetical protein B0H15DRAFT_796559 [Mycena belliarum]|uniref:Uncharacterized protein n=1 Tax=Mycena belliarum TaxID=1033014 RepID=A0AAD6Y0G2_9AGAR|nr:hypothetical protein B0H15DRAFT_796559 [Mycena belliae]
MSADGMRQVCSGIKTLALTACVGPPILFGLSAMQVRRLSIGLVALLGEFLAIDLSHSAFLFVAHFESYDNHRCLSGYPCRPFAGLPALTHLATWQLNKAAATELLSKCMKLEVLVRMWHPDDARFVSISFSFDKFTTTNWLAGTEDVMDFWARAEAFHRQEAARRDPALFVVSRLWAALILTLSESREPGSKPAMGFECGAHVGVTGYRITTLNEGQGKDRICEE